MRTNPVLVAGGRAVSYTAVEIRTMIIVVRNAVLYHNVVKGHLSIQMYLCMSSPKTRIFGRPGRSNRRLERPYQLMLGFAADTSKIVIFIPILSGKRRGDCFQVECHQKTCRGKVFVQCVLSVQRMMIPALKEENVVLYSLSKILRFQLTARIYRQ